MKCHDILLCCFGVHIWRFQITPTFGINRYQDGAFLDGWCVICDRDY